LRVASSACCPRKQAMAQPPKDPSGFCPWSTASGRRLATLKSGTGLRAKAKTTPGEASQEREPWMRLSHWESKARLLWKRAIAWEQCSWTAANVMNASLSRHSIGPQWQTGSRRDLLGWLACNTRPQGSLGWRERRQKQDRSREGWLQGAGWRSRSSNPTSGRWLAASEPRKATEELG
jgi:hypothetical protein